MHGNVVCCLPPHHLYLTFLPMLSLPNSSPPAVPPLASRNRPQCMMLPSSCPCALIVQHPPMNENIQCLVFCSCINLLGTMVSRFIHVPIKDTNSSCFYGCIVFHAVYVDIFLVQSIISGHLGWFQVFSIVNSATVNIRVRVHVSL